MDISNYEEISRDSQRCDKKDYLDFLRDQVGFARLGIAREGSLELLTDIESTEIIINELLDIASAKNENKSEKVIARTLLLILTLLINPETISKKS